MPDKLFFFGSYFRPERSRELQSNAYGDLPDFEYERNEGFGKLTFTPASNVLVNASYRDSKREETSNEFTQFQSATTGSGSEARQKIAIGELSWVLGPRSLFTAKYTNFALETLGQPDFVSSAQVSTALGTQIDFNALDTLGRLTRAGADRQQSRRLGVHPALHPAIWLFEQRASAPVAAQSGTAAVR